MAKLTMVQLSHNNTFHLLNSMQVYAKAAFKTILNERQMLLCANIKFIELTNFLTHIGVNEADQADSEKSIMLGSPIRAVGPNLSCMHSSAVIGRPLLPHLRMM